jgi:hypothetical protein
MHEAISLDRDPLDELGLDCAVAGIAFAFTLERVRWLWSLFSRSPAASSLLVFFWNGSPERLDAGDEWRLFPACSPSRCRAPCSSRFAIAASGGSAPARSTPMPGRTSSSGAPHGAFVLVPGSSPSCRRAVPLIGIDLLRDALEELGQSGAGRRGARGAHRFASRSRQGAWETSSASRRRSFGACAGPAAGLALFVLALPFTGLAPLWEKTSSTTPILLVAIAGAFLLANAIIGNAPEEEASATLLSSAPWCSAPS